MTALKCLDPAVRNVVSSAVLAGAEPIDLEKYERPIPGGREVDVDLVLVLLQEVQTRFADDRPKSDAWLGPRLHASLRLSRQEAGNDGVWRWLAFGPGADYVRWRWTALNPDRFLGDRKKQAFASLWWTAELFRNGSDYSPAVAALSNQDISNNLLAMGIAHHRPTNLAFLRVKGKDGVSDLTGREANALAKAINCASITVALEERGPAESNDAEREAARTWRSETVPIADLVADSLPVGPPDGLVGEESVESLRALFTDIFSTASVRGKKKAGGKKPKPPAEGHGPDPDGRVATVSSKEAEGLSDRVLEVGRTYRYAKGVGSVDEKIDGATNWHWATEMGDLPKLMLERGINVSSADGLEAIPLVALRISAHKAGTETTPWVDRVDLDNHRVVYFGDNKVDDSGESDSWSTPRLGNRSMSDVAAMHASELKRDRTVAPPLLILRSESEKGFVTFLGVGRIRQVERVVQEDPQGRSFQNFEYHIELVDIDDEPVRVSWLHARRIAALGLTEALQFAPTNWQSWVNDGR